MVGKKISPFYVLILAGLFCFSPFSVYAQDAIPEDFVRDSVIVVPGIVGSYNILGLFADKSIGSWGPVPFYKIYQGLVARLETEGYVKDTDLFVAYYDWRQPNAESAREFLAPIIAQAKEKTGRVDIIAHSMGGLLVQQYINSDQYIPGEIDQFVMLGTPNEGSSAAYLPWEGGVFPSTWSAPVRFYIKSIHDSLKKKRDIQDVAPKSYRQIFPSLKELLPVGNYIQNGDVADTSTERNIFLETLIAARDALLMSDIVVTTIAGDNNNTLGTIEVSGERSEADQQLERWRDGHPSQEVPVPNNPDGDKTVLKSSALFGPNQVTVGNVPHDALPEYAQDEALQALGIDIDKPKIFTYEEPKWLTGFVVLSPVDIVITDATGKTVSKDTNDFGEDAFIDVSEDESADDPKVVILRNLPPGTYTVHLTGTGTGSYTVITTHTDAASSESETLTGNTVLGKQESFTVTIGGNGTSMNVIPITPVGPAIGEPGDDQDCCPGHDVVISKKVSKGKVLGATMKKAKKPFDKLGVKGPVTLEELKPLNDIFFSVYGRIPTFAEWKYWTKRYSTDKRDWEKIRGAMYWHKARGST